jgi:hypothetical protein
MLDLRMEEGHSATVHQIVGNLYWGMGTFTIIFSISRQWSRFMSVMASRLVGSEHNR